MTCTTIDELQARVAAAEPNGCVKINIEHEGGQNEGVWVYFVTPADKLIWDRDTHDVQFEVFLVNPALIGCPCWGARLKMQTKGAVRPQITVAEVVRQIEEAVVNQDYPTTESWTEWGNAEAAKHATITIEQGVAVPQESNDDNAGIETPDPVPAPT